MDSRTILFGKFPRYVGNPYQKKVHNISEFNRFVSVCNGLNDHCFCSKFAFQKNSPIIDGSFFESDSNDLELALKETKKVYNWFQKENICCIPLFSGKKGFHLHPIFKPKVYENPSSVLANFANLVLSETNVETFDRVVISDIRRLVRIPNTIRENGNWCIPLKEFDNLDEILYIAKSPQVVDYNFDEPKYYHTDFVKENKLEEIEWIEPDEKKTGFLHDVLRPCIYEQIITPNPSEIIRSDTVIELLNYGLSREKIVDLFQPLNWIDFSRAYTLYRIDFIIEKRNQNQLRRPFGKKKLNCNKNQPCWKCFKK